MPRSLPPEAALLLDRSQRRGGVILLALAAGLTTASIAALVAGWPQVLFFPALLGGVGTAWSALRLGRILGRRQPPSYSVEVGADGITGAWGGEPPRCIAWQDVRQVVPQGAGFVVVARGGGVVIVPAELPDVAGLLASVHQHRAGAPPPTTETRLGVAPFRERVDEVQAARIRRIDAVRPWLGWGALLSFAAVGLALAVEPRGIVAAVGAAALLGGAWWALVFGLRAWVLGASAVATALVVQTVYRGRWGRALAALQLLGGLSFAAVGALVLVAAVATLLFG